MNNNREVTACEHCISYFHFFEYPPTTSEIRSFFPELISEEHLSQILKSMIKQAILFQDGDRFAFEKRIFHSFRSKKIFSQQLLREYEKIHPILVRIPTLKFIGISGSLSMANVGRTGDIDLFIITKAGTLWITRFLLLFITRFLGLLGNPGARKLCINMIWEDDCLLMPQIKRNEYTAHEILQLRPMFDTNNIYSTFVEANRWIYQLFPNVQENMRISQASCKPSQGSKIVYVIDKILEYLQRVWLTYRGITVHTYARQLWLIQKDLEEEIPLKLKRV